MGYAGGTFADAMSAYPEVRDRIVSDRASIMATGQLPFMHDMNETLEADLVRAELIALPLALLVLVLVFRTLVAAALPVGVGGMAVIGGIGSIGGAVLGGLLLGIIELMTVAFLPELTGYKDAFAFVLLIVVLLVKPTGLLGKNQGEKV